MTGQDYEYAAARYLRRHGFRGVRVTRATGDYGVDVICRRHGRRYAVQCKYYSHPVGLAAVQQAVAGKAQYGCDAAMVITNNTLTRPARALAESNDVLVLEGIEPGFHLPERASRFLRWYLALVWMAAAAWIIAARLVLGALPPELTWDTLQGKGMILLLATPVLLLPLMLMRRLLWWIACRREVRKEARLRQRDQADEADLLACMAVADRERAPLPEDAYLPAEGRPDRRSIRLFFGDSALMRCVLDAVGDRRRFSLKQLADRGRLSPDAARTLTDCLVSTGFLVCTRPGRYAWSRYTEKAASMPDAAKRNR